MFMKIHGGGGYGGQLLSAWKELLVGQWFPTIVTELAVDCVHTS